MSGSSSPRARAIPAGAQVELRLDQASFEAPLDAAIEDCRQTFMAAARHVKGSEARVKAALDDWDSLNEFKRAVETCMQTAAFHELPGLRRGKEALGGLRQLNKGPWRGVFLVDQTGLGVIGLVFSKEPHDLRPRLEEIAAPYRA